MAAPGCVLRVSGVDLNPEDALQHMSLHAISIWHKGDIRRKICTDAGFVVNVSDRETLSEQVEEAVQFVTAQRAALKELCSDTTIEDIRLDFGIALRDAVVQTNIFPRPLVQLAGECGIVLELSQYSPD